MTRRTGLMAIFAVVSRLLQGDAEARQATIDNGITFSVPKVRDLTVRLGGDWGYERFHFTDGTDTVTFTAEELMAALKESQ